MCSVFVVWENVKFRDGNEKPMTLSRKTNQPETAPTVATG